MGWNFVLKRFVVLLSVVLIVVVVCPAARADFGSGVKAYDDGDYAGAIAAWQPLAEQGNLEAQFGLGIIYENGRGIGRDYAQAADWYTQAAEGGHPGAQFNLGNMYQQGLGVTKDASMAVYWWTLAAAQGLSEAQLNLGIAYHRGNGVEADQNQALSWFERAAEAGNAMGQFSAGYAYETGLGTEPDIAVARRYYTAAAEAGVQQAATRLAELGPATEDEQIVEEMTAESVTAADISENKDNTIVEATVEISVADETVDETQEATGAAVDYSDSNQSTGETSTATQQSALGGGPFIQLAAYLSENRAEDAWQTVIDRYPDILDGLPHRVLVVDLGGELGTVYRLQAGPMPTHGEAQAICSQLQQRNADCFLVEP